MNSLYSCLEITPQSVDHECSRVRLFTYGRGQQLPASSTAASTIHTNVPRSSDSGLPMGWGMQVDYWRAVTNAPFRPEPVLQWAADTSVELVYNSRIVAQHPLLDILLAPHALSMNDEDSARLSALERSGELQRSRPLRLRENLSFYVTLETRSAATVRMLKHWLIEDMLELVDPEKKLGADWLPKFRCWIYLEGVLSRNVM